MLCYILYVYCYVLCVVLFYVFCVALCALCYVMCFVLRYMFYVRYAVCFVCVMLFALCYVVTLWIFYRCDSCPTVIPPGRGARPAPYLLATERKGSQP